MKAKQPPAIKPIWDTDNYLDRYQLALENSSHKANPAEDGEQDQIVEGNDGAN